MSIAGIALPALSAPISPCASFLSLSGLESLSEKGVRKLPLEVLEEKLKTKERGTSRLTLPLELTMETSPIAAENEQVMLPLEVCTFRFPEFWFICILPLDERNVI